MSERIFGMTWDEIQALQNRGPVRRATIDLSKPSRTVATDADRAMLAEYGSIEALKLAGFHGSADKLSRE